MPPFSLPSILYSNGVGPLETAFRSATIYLVILGALRVMGKRHVAQLSIIDFVLVLLVSNAVQNSMVGSDTSLGGGLVAAVTLLTINYALGRLVVRYERLGTFLEGEPTLLIRDGKILDNHLAREGIRRAELEAAIRSHGYTDETEVRQAVLEIDGAISVLPFGQTPQEHRIPPIVQRGQRHRRGGRADRNDQR